jgi:F-type H+-transporting ATPase subunit b
MHIDWWTLALRTVNVLILMWLLAKFLFRPVAKIVASRQDEANKLLEGAAESRRQADEARVELDRAHAGIADERNRVLADAHAAAETARVSSLAQGTKRWRSCARKSTPPSPATASPWRRR